MLKASLRYDKGTIVIEGLAHIPFATLDPRINALRAQALYYPNIIEYLKQSGIEYTDRVFSDIITPFSDMRHYDDHSLKNSGSNSNSAPIPLSSSHQQQRISETTLLRDYQQKALDNWTDAGMRGCIVLPTGAGKTLVGIKAIEKVNAPSLVVVPTLDLMDQWTSVLSKYFIDKQGGEEKRSALTTKIGNLGGGSDNIEPITVSTYDSAYLRAPLLGNKFMLVVFDEVHHLAALGYRTIAEQMAAPYRLGLTATIEREDELHTDLPRLVGGVVLQITPDVLARQKHLAQYEVERRKVELLPEELVQYKQNMHRYQECVNQLAGARWWGQRAAGGGDGGSGRSYYDYKRRHIPLEKLIIMSGRNPIAREALLARNKANAIALNSRSKLEELKEILAENKGIKTIIFTQYNNMVYEISNKFLIPFITYKTGKDERQDVLKGFKDGRYMAIVTSKVLDEGVDVPDAELGIIVSGTGSAREFIQRLGRLLRPKQNMVKITTRTTVVEAAAKDDDSGGGGGSSSKKAKLIEIVSIETKEETVTSAKRKRALKTIQEKEQTQQRQQQQGENDDGDDNNSTYLKEVQ